MQGDAKVIEYLNKGLRSELTAINQYWLHFRLLNHWGLLELAKQWRKESIEEMHHADRFTDRILFLDGFPNMQVLDPLRIGPRSARVTFIRKPQPTATASRTTSRAICSRA
jgi:bacterioferritin